MSIWSFSRFVVGRLIWLACLLLIVSFGVFSLLYIAPGSVEQAILGTRPASPETFQALRDRYHLDEPFLVQYWEWLRHALQLDFGTSIRTSEPVSSAVRERAGLSFFLGAYAFLLVLLVGLPLGILAALRKRTMLDRSVVGASVIGVSTPAFASGIFLLYVFSVRLGWFPAFGPGDGFLDRVWHLTLPAIALAFTTTALLLKITRAALITELDQDYVVFAKARGLTRRHVVALYALRNAWVPIVTAASLIVASVITGAVLVEVTFSLPGLGALLIDSVTFKDLPMVQAITLFIVVIIVLINLLTDILYFFIDPRIQIGARS